MSDILVAAVGSELRRDDGVGLAILERLHHLRRWPDVRMLQLADPIHLLGAWDKADLCVILDALRSTDHPSRVQVVTLRGAAEPVGGAMCRAMSSHALGVEDAVRVAEALDTAPSSVMVVGIGGLDFSPGVGLSVAVENGIEEAAHRVEELVESACAVIRG